MPPPSVNAQTPPDPINWGPKILRNWLNALLDFTIAIRPIPGNGTTMVDGPDGRAINASGQSGAIPTATKFPFQLISASDESGSKIRVVYGTVNGFPPDGFSPGDIPPYVVPASGTGSVYLEVTTDDDGNITDRSVGVNATVPGDSFGDYHLEIGSYAVAGDGISLSIAQSISGSQAFELCGGVTPLWGLT